MTEMAREYSFTVSLNRQKMILLSAVFFLGWHPALLNSETLTMTTYYPAPYGGYVSLLTTGNTYLSRDSGRLGVGTASPQEKVDVNGNIKWGSGYGLLTTNQGASIELGGNGTSPFIDFHRDAADYSARLINWAGNTLTLEGNLRIGTTIGGADGMIERACSHIPYGTGGDTHCPTGTKIIGYFGDGVGRVNGYLSSSPSSWVCVWPLCLGGSDTYYVSLGTDWAGTMVCCRFTD